MKKSCHLHKLQQQQQQKHTFKQQPIQNLQPAQQQVASMQPPMEAINLLTLTTATAASQQQNRSHQDSQCTRCGIKWVSFVLQVLLVALSSTLVSSILPTELQRLNYGVTFKPRAQLQLAVETWTHTFEITLLDNLNMTELPGCTKDAKTCSFFNKMLHEVHQVGYETEVVINRTLKSIYDLVPEKKLGVRSRSHQVLPSFIDGSSRSIAGTARVEDAEHLAHHINALNKITSKAAPIVEQHEENLASYMKSCDEGMNNIVQQLKSNEFAIEHIQKQLYKSLDNLEKVFSTMIVLMAKHIETSQKIEHRFNEILNGVNQLVEGKLSPHLIQLKTMSKAISDIQQILHNKYPGFNLVYTDAGDIYRNVESLYAREGSTLYVAVKIPITPFRKPLLLFDVLSFPVPVSDATNHATQLFGLPKLFAVTDNKQFYTTFEPDELIDCITSGTDNILCNINKVLRSMLTRTCVSSIFQNDKIMVKQDCDFRFLVDHVKSNIFVLNEASIVVYKTETLVFTCNSSKCYVTGCDFCMISLPCQCSVLANNIYLPQRLSSCQENSITKSHLVNLAVLQQFFNDTSLQSIESNSVFVNPLTITLPQFSLYNHSMSQIIADDTKSHLSLQKMAKAAKNDAIAFPTLTEPLLAGQILCHLLMKYCCTVL